MAGWVAHAMEKNSTQDDIRARAVCVGPLPNERAASMWIHRVDL
jgi:citrate synthase